MNKTITGTSTEVTLQVIKEVKEYQSQYGTPPLSINVNGQHYDQYDIEEAIVIDKELSHA
ncbi:hypothetical protein F7U66_02040 [Vibrio parahaemolyticus]|nr:hypothetical protein [Vibrio parahaemolyticus]